ncbi:MAG: HAMP domain-containing histidine kinase [Bacteroidales bacterium]|nr:HAMP domain-containing histidine kinase [Bacteroidales bacterium]
MKFLNYVASILLALTVSALNLTAQVQNRLGVEESIFEPYSKCRLSPYDVDNISICDSIYSIGVQRNDYKIKTLALNAVLPAYYMLEDLDMMNKTIQEIKDIQYSHPDINDIYFAALYSYCNYLIFFDKLSDSLLEAKQMLERSTEIGEPYGMMLAYRTMAIIYQYRSNSALAVECYKRALEYSESANASVEQDNIRIQLAQEQINAGLYDNARETLSVIARSIDNDENLRLQYYFVSAYLGDNTGDHESFWKYYNLVKDEPMYESIIGEEDRALVEIDYLLSKGEIDKAEQVALEYLPDQSRHMILSEIYGKKGLYKLAYEESTAFNKIKDSLSVAVQTEDVAMLDAQMANAELKHESLQYKSRVRTMTLSVALIIFIIISILSILNIIREQKHKRALKAKNYELIEAKKTTEAALEKAKESDAIKTRFLQNMSHEIRTPLNAVVGFSQLLSLPDGINTEQEKNEYSNYILNNSEMLTMLIDDIISLSDVENGNYKINKSKKNCNDIIRHAIKSVEHRVSPGVTLKWESDFTDEDLILTDERRVQQVLINLLTNACKHTEKGTITIRCCSEKNNGYVNFEVIDTGTGIPKDKAEKIFDRFFKIDEFKQGAGIGLNICKIITSKLGGELYLDTTYENGAKFVFSIPKN